jgi:hypothetical protein
MKGVPYRQFLDLGEGCPRKYPGRLHGAGRAFEERDPTGGLGNKIHL